MTMGEWCHGLSFQLRFFFRFGQKGMVIQIRAVLHWLSFFDDRTLYIYRIHPWHQQKHFFGLVQWWTCHKHTAVIESSSALWPMCRSCQNERDMLMQEKEIPDIHEYSRTMYGCQLLQKYITPFVTQMQLSALLAWKQVYAGSFIETIMDMSKCGCVSDLQVMS